MASDDELERGLAWLRGCGEMFEEEVIIKASEASAIIDEVARLRSERDSLAATVEALREAMAPTPEGAMAMLRRVRDILDKAPPARPGADAGRSGDTSALPSQEQPDAPPTSTPEGEPADDDGHPSGGEEVDHEDR